NSLPCVTYTRFFFSIPRRPPPPTLFPYTTLFRSHTVRQREQHGRGDACRDRRRSATPSGDLLDYRRCRSGQVFDRWRQPIGLQRSEEHTSELQSQSNLVCRLLLEKKKTNMRGKKITDVICNGTDLRPPLAMPKGSLSFDNTTPLLPADAHKSVFTNHSSLSVSRHS